MKHKKFIAFIAIIVIISTISIISLYIIINAQGNTPPDNIPPIVNITKPTEGESLSGSITIIFTANDQQGFIKEKQILIDEIIVQTSSFSYIWDTTQEVDGSHNILCKAKDKTVWGYDEVTVTIDNVEDSDNIPPNVTITSPINGSIVSGNVIITMDATDTNGINSYVIYIDDIFRSNTQSYFWDTTQEINGSHTILCEAIDPSGNIGSDIISVIVNNTDTNLESPIILKLMTFNIKDSGEDPAYPDWKTVIKEENADIIVFLETGYWDDNENEKLNQYVYEFNTYFTHEDPYIGYCTQGITYATDGAAIMSRYPILTFSQIPYVLLDNNTIYDVTHDFFDVEINASGTLMHIISSHLKALSGSENEQIRKWEQEGIINYMDNLGSTPIVYLGDLNSFSPEDWGLNTLQTGLGYGPLSMMIPPYNNPETYVDYSAYSSTIHNWTDVHRTLNPNDWGITYPSYDSRIDFIYINQFLFPTILNSTTGDTAHAITGSDHFSVDVFINLTLI